MEEVGSNEVIPFNMLFSKCLVELKVPKLLRQLPAMELYDRSSGLNDHLSLFLIVFLEFSIGILHFKTVINVVVLLFYEIDFLHQY